MKMNKSGAVLMVFIAAAMLLMVDKWRTKSANDALKKNILSALQGIKHCPGGKLDLAAVVPDRYADLCLQSAYMPRKDFEKQTGKRAKGYDVLLHDGGSTWWLFEKNGRATTLDMSGTAMVKAPSLEAGKCFSREKSIIVFACHANQASYQIEEK
ncbi:hypothetical protein [Massilia sp. TSP1-1-2]|uniref:hypothetical protein n=1 Tax=Massilia sp. TSP1-1-2 TaxID=2804649 RepID=UPI003CEF1B6A